MKKILSAVFAVVFLCGCAIADSVKKDVQKDNDRLMIGWAKRSIAMKGNVPVTGQAFLRVSHGEYTPVIASALAMSNSKDAVIFVAVDLENGKEYYA